MVNRWRIASYWQRVRGFTNCWPSFVFLSALHVSTCSTLPISRLHHLHYTHFQLLWLVISTAFLFTTPAWAAARAGLKSHRIFLAAPSIQTRSLWQITL